MNAIEIREDALQYAISNGVIDNGAVWDEDMVREADFLIFGLYPQMTVDWLRDHQHLLKSGAIITDVSGVKKGVVDEIQSFLREDVEFISSHPMAGKEVGGVENSDEKIFLPANFLIVPTEKNTSRGVAFARELAQALNFANIAVLSMQEHDEMIGYVSQLTHAIAVSLMTASDNTHLKDYTGDSFRDLTRIAKINDVLWSELFFLNREVLIGEIDQFSAELQRLRGMLMEKDEKGLREMFRLSSKRRAEFDK